MAELTICRMVIGVETRQSQNGRTYWRVSDDTQQQWTTWEANTATAALNLQGQLTQMRVRIAPASDPQYGMNLTLKAIQAAPPGSTPTPSGQEMQMAQQMQAMPQQAPSPQQMMPLQPVGNQQPTAQLPAPPVKTLGQGGNLSDADITRMARSTAIEAVVGAAFHPDDFRDEEENLDWTRVYAAAEAVSKFILQRSHQGWIPGVEIESPKEGEQQVLAEVQAQFGEGLVEEPNPVPVAQASADNANGGDVDWGA
jgi:hypothetical protein